MAHNLLKAVHGKLVIPRISSSVKSLTYILFRVEAEYTSAISIAKNFLSQHDSCPKFFLDISCHLPNFCLSIFENSVADLTSA